jgi:hypothetical protein
MTKGRHKNEGNNAEQDKTSKSKKLEIMLNVINAGWDIMSTRQYLQIRYCRIPESAGFW